VVIDLAPYWRPPTWAEAVSVVDAVVWHGADRAVLEQWRDPVRRPVLLRAALFRLLSEAPGSPVTADLTRTLDPMTLDPTSPDRTSLRAL